MKRLLNTAATLRRVAALVSPGASASETFSAVARETAQFLGADVTGVFRYEPDGTAVVVGWWGVPGMDVPVGARLTVAGEGLAVSVLRHGQPARTDRFEGPAGSVAARFRQLGVWGALAVLSRRGPFPAGAEQRITHFSELAATAIANAESRAELVASRNRIVAASDRARRELERDLHDGVQQRLVSLTLMLRRAQKRVPATLPELGASLSQAAEGLSGVLTELQEISRGIHPAILSQGGLAAALRTLARRSATPVKLSVEADRLLLEQVEVGAYYVAAEALANVAKHARASVVYVDVDVHHGALRLRVRDDGVGGADPARGSGLIGLNDRVEALGGTMHVHSPLGEGTSLLVTLPIVAP